MLVQQKLGNLQSASINNRSIDLLPVEWHETDRRILHKRSVSGREVTMKFMKESPALMQDDIVYEDENSLIVVDIQPCEAIVVRPASLNQMACLCYEVGNRHLPVYLQDDEVLVPFEAPLFRLLVNAGFEPRKEVRKLLRPLKTTVAPHGQSTSLFSKLLQLTTPAPDA